MTTTTRTVEQLLKSNEPSVRFKVLVRVLGEDPTSRKIKCMQTKIKNSPRVEALLAPYNDSGNQPQPNHPYAKWVGAHWVLADLAELGYPAGDKSLIALREQILGWLLSDDHAQQIKTINGRVRRCASQEGNAIFSLLTLGLADDRVDELAARLRRWQWPDGGWNCDKRPDACHSSFMESLIPMRALLAHARWTGHVESRLAAERAAEIFLKRHLYKRQSDGSIISEDFTKLHYPCYWHYDILFGLKVMAEAHLIEDSRCGDALDLLQSKQLADGGYPAEKKFSGRSLVSWGGVSQRRMNEWVTADALAVLKSAGRWRFNEIESGTRGSIGLAIGARSC